MKTKLIGVAAAAVVVFAGIGVTVGGWVTNQNNDSQTEASETSKTADQEYAEVTEEKTKEADKTTKEQTETAKENTKTEEKSKGTVVKPIAYNNDEPLVDLGVLIVDQIGDKMIFEISNPSDVCYKYVDVDVYFNCDPLPNRKPTDDEYHNGYNFWNIPAHSVTYHVAHAFWEGMGKEGEGGYHGEVYYPFRLGSDPYRVAIGVEDLPLSAGYKISDDLIQNAMDYIEVDQAGAERSKNKLATVTNFANRHVEFTGYAILDNEEVIVIQNGSELIDSSYEDIIPAYNVEFSSYGDRVYDCNSLYTKPYDFNLSGYSSWEVVIGNAWFNDEVEEENSTAGPKPTVAK